MVKVLRKKVVSEIRTSYLQYLSVILIAMLSVTLFTGIFANYRNLDDRLNQIYEKTNMSDLIVTFNGYDQKDEEFLQNLDLDYEKRIYLTGKAGTVNVNIIVFDENTKMNLPTEVSKDQYDTNDVLVDSNFLKRKNLQIGDTTEIEISTMKLDAKITGTMIHPEALDNSTYSSSLIYVGIDVIRAKFSSLGSLFDSLISLYYNQYVIKCENSDDILTKINQYYANKENNNLVYAAKRMDMPSNISIEADVIQAKKMLYIFPVMFYLVGVLIILTSISQLINKERMNIGIMKSFGYSKKEILTHYMSITVLLCLIGGIFGIILGPLIIPKVMDTKYQYLYQLPHYRVPFFHFEYLISVVILVIVSIITSYIACHKEINKKPIESLRGENSVTIRRGILEKTSFFQKIPLTIRMALRNMKRKISRTLMVILGLLGCSALLVCGFGIDNTLNYGLNLEIDELINYDVSVGYTNSGSKKPTLEQLDGVEVVEEYAKLGITLQSNKIISTNLYLLPKESAIFTCDYHQDGFLISKKVAEETGAKIGDEIEIIYGDKTFIDKVSGIANLCITQGVFISYDKLEDLEFKPNAAWIKTTDYHNNENLASKIEELAGIESVTTNKKMHEVANNVTSTIRIMTTTIKIFAILLAVVVLYNLALLNFEERTRDIATLKVLGFNRLEIATSLTFEILTSTLIGSLIGLLFGYPLLVAVLKVNENPLLTYIYHINPSTYLLTILLTCGVSIIMNSIFSLLVKKVKMVESLKSVD